MASSALATDAPAAVADPAVSDPGAVLTGQGLLLQEDGKGPVVCFGAVQQSLPPQCDGPDVVGLDWADLPEADMGLDVRWSEAQVVGTFDGSTFTLTEPPGEIRTPVEPGGGTGADPYPQLCEDLFRGADPGFDVSSETGDAAEEQLGHLLQDYDGYVDSWVSDGYSKFNVLVTGDAEQAHADFREVWHGGLCVEQRDLPTHDQVLQAQETVSQAGIENLWDNGGGMGRLRVGVVRADAETVEAIHTAVEPWLTPDQVEIVSALTPVQP